MWSSIIQRKGSLRFHEWNITRKGHDINLHVRCGLHQFYANLQPKALRLRYNSIVHNTDRIVGLYVSTFEWPSSFLLQESFVRMPVSLWMLPSCVFCLVRIFVSVSVNLLKPTGHVMHRQFNIQQLYILPTLYLCVLYLSENKQRLVKLTAWTDWIL